jgi:hypothetical protein
MSTIILEQIEPEIPEEPDQPGESLEQEAVPSVPEPTPTETPAPAPKKRGRPPKAKVEAPPPIPKAKAPKAPKPRKPWAPPVEDSSDSSDVDTTLRNVYNHVAKPDMETAILQFLVNRKQAESTRRRELWGRLAQM